MFLNENHELLLLLLNSVRKDLDSTNILEVAAAMSCMTWLLNKDTVHAILPLVIDKTKSTNELVRKKAVILIHRCLQKDVATTWNDVENVLRSRLCDTDPSVMAATLHCFIYVIELKRKDPIAYSFLPSLVDLVPSFVGILKQLIDKRLPSHYNYHNVHAPWIQISLLRVLRYLGSMDPSSVTHMTEVLKLILTAPADKMAACAIVNEAIRTICDVQAGRALLDLCARNIALFLGATSSDLNYLGLTLLAKIVAINPIYAAEHQAYVISCLESPDESIRSKTIELLFHMSNVKNLVVIVEKMLDRLRKTTDVFLRTELVTKITTLSEKFSTDNYWFITTMNEVFLVAGDTVPIEVAHKFLRYISEGATDDEDANVDLRMHAVNAYMQLASNPHLSDVLQMVMAWVLGEYGYLVENPLEAVNALVDLLERPPNFKHGSSSHKATKFIPGSLSAPVSSIQSMDSFAVYYGSEVKPWIVSALAKLAASTGVFPLHVREAFTKLIGSDNTELSRRCQDLLYVLDTATAAQRRSLLEEVFPLDASAEDLVPSEILGATLDQFVNNALAHGARAYARPVDRSALMTTRVTKEEKALRWKAYERPAEPTRFSQGMAGAPGGSPMGTQQQNYNPLMTMVPTGGTSVPGPRGAHALGPENFPGPTAMGAPPTSLASIGAVAGPWSSAGFAKPGILPVQTQPASQPYMPPSQATAPSYVQTTTPSANPASTVRPELETYRPKMDPTQTRLANALFSGVGDSPNSSPTSTNIISGAAKKRAARPSGRPSGGTETGTLISIDSDLPSPTSTSPLSTTRSPYSTTSPAPQENLLLLVDPVPEGPQSTLLIDNSASSSRSGSLLDGLDVHSTPSQSPIPSRISRPAPSVTEVDLLGDLSSMSLSPSPSASSLGFTAPSSEVMQFTESSALSSNGNTNGGPLRQISFSADDWNLQNLIRTPLVSNLLEPYIPQNSVSIPFSKDADPFLHIAYIKGATAQGSNIGILLGNRTSIKIANVRTIITTKAPLFSDLQTDSATDIKASSLGHFETLAPTIAPHSASLLVLQVSLSDKASMTYSATGEISFEVHGQPKTLRFRLPISLEDFLRPEMLPIDRFGAAWTSSSIREVKIIVSSSPQITPVQVGQRLESAGFGVIQAGKSEVVSACRVLESGTSTQGDSRILLHAKVDNASQTVELTFRSESISLAEITSRFFQTITF
jgi:AP-4 complex subunit epsilon-1